MGMTRIRLEVTPVENWSDVGVLLARHGVDGPARSIGEDAKAWSVTADGEEAGALQGVRSGDVVDLTFFVAESHRRRGIARAAVGRILGRGAWGGDVRYRITESDAAVAAVARATGFAPAGVTDAGQPLWVRDAPRPRPQADDITRFLDRDGRIDRYPLRSPQRRELLELIVERAVPHGRVFTEAEINECLGPFAPADDVAVLRRYLVDHGLLERTRSGSEYARTSQ